MYQETLEILLDGHSAWGRLHACGQKTGKPGERCRTLREASFVKIEQKERLKSAF